MLSRGAARSLQASLAKLAPPTSPLLWYSRALAAEAASNHPLHGENSGSTVGGTVATEKSNFDSLSHVQPHLDEAIKAAYARLVSTIFSQIDVEATKAPHTAEYEGLKVLEEQEKAADGSAIHIESQPLARSLAAIRYHQSMMDGTPRGRKLQENWQRQLTLETRAVDAALAKYRREAKSMVQRGAGAALPAARRLLVSWFHPLTEAIRAEQYRIAKGESGMDRSVYGPFLLRLDPEQLAVITMHAAINAFMSPEEDADAAGSAPGTARMTKLAVAIGRAVEAQFQVNRLERACHEQNMRRKELKDLFAEGKLLRNKLTEDGDLSQEHWGRWFEIGKSLRAAGEILPLDHLLWFEDIDDSVSEGGKEDGQASSRSAALSSVEARAKELAQHARRVAGEAPSENELRLLTARTRRLLASDGDGMEGEWRADMQAKVGVILIKLLMDSCTLDVTRDGETKKVPAFWHQLEQGPDVRLRGVWKRYGLLYADEEVMNKIKPHHMKEAFIPQFLPMVVTPVPWQRHNLGGYLTLRSSVMRVRGSHAQRDSLQEADRAMVEGRGLGLSQVYDALNALGETPWSINYDVYRVVEAIWAWGGGICDIPQRDNVEVPPILQPGFRLHRNPEGGGFSLLAYPKSTVSRRVYMAQKARKKNNELHSLRCDLEYKLAIAREFSREERFYFPHNVDFRGRAYPMHPHLNHLGSDMCRGLLQFAEPRSLGPNGLRWLYIQAANLWGHGIDKLPLEGRCKWAEDNLGTILDNATDPFRQPPGAAAAIADGYAVLQSIMTEETGDKTTPYWYHAESPFQFLATCFDLYRALASGDPATYKSQLPVHQDGSCNGLQHYAALGRDLTGGWAVNLCPVERPQDVYSEIARLVSKRVSTDAAAGVPEAVMLQSSTPIDRKLVKQTVMTSVYGVTFVGARTQISNRLKERGFEDNAAMYKVSCYSAKVTLDCLHEMFQSAKHIMQWLSECARLIAKQNRAVGWTTPLGLPVLQPYRRKTQQHVRTVLQRLVLATNHDEKPVIKQRQRTAFPPNYIHSIDSSHMMLTAIACKRAGLDFAGVHDSFWTHAGTVDQMNAILRETFIELHSRPLLESLLEEFQAKHPDITFPPLPPRGDLTLDDIRGAKYFFS